MVSPRTTVWDRADALVVRTRADSETAASLE